MDELNSRLEKLRSLTPREREVLGLVCQGGRSYAEVGDALFISERTVLFHMGNVYEKLGLAELSKADRQRELGRFSPLLGYLNEDEPQPAEPEGHAQEPTEPRGLALIAVQEDAPVIQRQVSVEPWTGPPIDPGRVVTPKKGGFVGTVAPFLIVAALAGGLAIWGWNSLFPPPPRTTAPVPFSGTQQAAAVSAVPTATTLPTPQAVATATTRPPTSTPTAAVTPTATALVRTPDGSVLRLGDIWVGDGLLLTPKAPPFGSGSDIVIDFRVENRTGQRLDFAVPTQAFLIELNTGKRYIGNDAGFPPARFNDFQSGTSKDFRVEFGNGKWNEFQADKREPRVTSYVVGVTDFNDRLKSPRWQEPVVH